MKTNLLRKLSACFVLFALLFALLSSFVLADGEPDASISVVGGADAQTSLLVTAKDGAAPAQATEGNAVPEGTLFQKLLYRGVLQYFDGSPAYLAMMVGLYILTALIAYALGSLNFAVIISKLFYHDDVRSHGSGNAGSTNMLRTYGKGAAAGTFLGDALKVVLAILIAYLLVGKLMGGGYVAGLFAVIGHVYPVYYGFKGGKGVVASAITILMLDWKVFLVIFAIFVIVVAIWRYISLGSCLAAAAYPLVTFAAHGPSPAVLFAFLIACFVVFLHHTNIRRLLDGKENKFSWKTKKNG